MIKLFKDSLPDGRIIHFINKLNSNKRIGVINWWHIQESIPPTLEQIKDFLESVDITVFVNIEILLGFAGQQYLDDALNLIENYNVSYITFSEEPATLKWPAHRTFSMPWFLKSPVYIGKDFEPDLDYRDKPYDFNMLLGRKKPERDILWYALRNNQRVYSTYYGCPKNKQFSNSLYDEPVLTEFLDSQDVGAQSMGLKTMSKQVAFNDAFLSHIIPAKIYNNTHMDIVVETQCTRPELMFFTEKTSKPIATGRPFLLSTTRGTFEYIDKYKLATMPLEYYHFRSTVTEQLALLIETVEYITNTPGAMQDVYEKTRIAREYNIHRYRELIDQFDANLETWLHDQLNNY